MPNHPTKVFAGFADKNATLFRRIGVPLGDPAAVLETGDQSIAVVRDLEMDRVQKSRGEVQVTCPAEHPGEGRLSADRETATAQAFANLVKSRGITSVIGDRSLPMIFSWHLQQQGIAVEYDEDLGVADRRSKTSEEIEALAASQAVTEAVMRTICETLAAADVDDHGCLIHEGDVLTSERVRSMAAIAFLHRGFTMDHGAIVATAPHVADCHHAGTGPLRTAVPIIVDLFPRSQATRYWGDCTRTVVHGQPDAETIRMHAAVVEAKAACTAKLLPGTTAGEAHTASEAMLVRHGFTTSRGEITDDPTIQHGTGHGIGLDVHEPILLDDGGEAMLENEVFTVEPGLYGRRSGGVRVEDMIVVTGDGPKNLNQLHEGLDWRA